MSHRTEMQRAEDLAKIRHLLATGRAEKIRRDCGLAQTDVARAINVHASTYHRWESGDRLATGDAALRLLALLNRLERNLLGRVS